MTDWHKHIRQCGSESGKSEFNWKIIGQASSSIKLLTSELSEICDKMFKVVT